MPLHMSVWSAASPSDHASEYLFSLGTRALSSARHPAGPRRPPAAFVVASLPPPPPERAFGEALPPSLWARLWPLPLAAALSISSDEVSAAVADVTPTARTAAPLLTPRIVSPVRERVRVRLRAVSSPAAAALFVFVEKLRAMERVIDGGQRYSGGVQCLVVTGRHLRNGLVEIEMVRWPSVLSPSSSYCTASAACSASVTGGAKKRTWPSRSRPIVVT